ncbi:DNA repair protein [Atlantibacter hermannii]|nr:S24 family peptidase [Atlantibacter hermannii]NBD00713.1 DNA repair protein [Atlantibacter hermannii]
MGFPSPAADFAETTLSLDAMFIKRPHATYFMRAGQMHWRAGIMKDALLVIDSSLPALDGSIVVCALAGDYQVRRMRLYPSPHLEHLDTFEKATLADDDDQIFGVVAYIVNDARSQEFDDIPVI